MRRLWDEVLASAGTQRETRSLQSEGGSGAKLLFIFLLPFLLFQVARLFLNDLKSTRKSFQEGDCCSGAADESFDETLPSAGERRRWLRPLTALASVCVCFGF